MTQRQQPASSACQVIVAFAVSCIVLGIAPTAAKAQTKPDVIKGRVTADSGRVLPNATVIITRAPDRTSFQTSTDSGGRYQLEISQGTGDYLVHISAPDRKTFRKRVVRSAAETVFTVDAILTSGTQQLAAVTVRTTRPKPTRNGDFSTGVGNSERIVGDVAGAIPPDLAGDLNAAALTTPGLLPVPGGFSVLGVPASQNAITVGGMAFPGADLPRDARATTRVSTSTYDPSRGWFSGASVNADLVTGSLLRSSRGHFTLDAPALQSNAASTREAAQRFSGFQASYGADGPLTFEDHNFFNFSAQLSHRVADARSALTSGDQLLNAIGIAPDSVRRAISILQSHGIPANAAGANARTNDAGSFIARFDHAPVDLKTLAQPRTAFGATAYAKWSRSTALGVSPLTAPASGAESSGIIGSLEGHYSRFFATDYLNETRSGLSYSSNRSTPYLDIPSAVVAVQSHLESADETDVLNLGGSSLSNNRSSQWTWETINEAKFYAKGLQAHRVKLTADSRVDGVTQASIANTAGMFSYATLQDFADNQPQAYSLNVNSPETQATEWNGFIAASDLWRITPMFQVMYGARAEANRFLTGPAQDARIDRSVGSSTDDLPARFAISPRLGFTWYFKPPSLFTRSNSLGSFVVGPSAYLRGGIGEFRSMIPASLGLARGAASQAGISCVGSATPVPDWAAYVAGQAPVPSTCAPGGASTLADTAATFRYVDRKYNAPTSWRGNLGVGSVVARVAYSIEGTYSLNQNQPEFFNTNFTATPAFVTQGEGRSVFVPVAAIVPGSGVVSPVSSRLYNGLGPILAQRSDARSSATQFVVTATPQLLGNLYLSASYSLGWVNMTQHGFTGSTFQSPTESASSRGDLDVRHHFVASLGYTTHGVTLSGQAHVMSGLPFTPMVASDVNGDGLANDRAFVFNPASLAPSQFRDDLASLLRDGARDGRSCLGSFIGQAVARNECEGPWTALLNSQLSYGTKTLRAHRVSSINLTFANLLGGLDQAIHGENHLHDWGTTAIPDRVLYTVRGFDATTKSYVYAVNPNFGSTRTTAPLLRNPFRVTLDVSVALGRSPAEQQLEQWLQPGRAGHTGARLTVDDLKKRYERNVPDPYALVLQEADSLLLTRAQVDSLSAIRVAYRARLDSLWMAVGAHMAALEDRYDVPAALKYQEQSFDIAWELTRQEVQRTFPRLLSPLQLSLLPGWASIYYRSTTRLDGVRTYMFGAP